jgi:hypothetical protein
MTGLERALAGIQDLIETARADRDALTLARLLQRKTAICAALAAPEHHWHDPAQPVRVPHEQPLVSLVA